MASFIARLLHVAVAAVAFSRCTCLPHDPSISRLDRKERAVNSGGSLVAKYKFVDEYDRPIYVPDHRSFVVIECYGSNASALRPVAASSTIMKQSSTIFKVQLGKVSGPMWCESPNHRPSEKINVRLDYEPCTVSTRLRQIWNKCGDNKYCIKVRHQLVCRERLHFQPCYDADIAMNYVCADPRSRKRFISHVCSYANKEGKYISASKNCYDGKAYMYFHEFREPRNAYDFNAMVTPSLLNGIMRISLALNVIDPLHLATFNLDVTMRCWKPTDPPLEFLTRHLLDRRRQVINITIPRDCYKTYDFIFLKADVFETDVQMFTQVTVVPLYLWPVTKYTEQHGLCNSSKVYNLENFQTFANWIDYEMHKVLSWKIPRQRAEAIRCAVAVDVYSLWPYHNYQVLLDSKFSTPDSTTDPPQDYLIPIVRPNIPKQMYQGKLCKKCAP